MIITFVNRIKKLQAFSYVVFGVKTESEPIEMVATSEKKRELMLVVFECVCVNVVQ